MNSSAINVNVDLNDVVTPKSCSVLICALIKHLMYMQEQIPYTYESLKCLITKRKELMGKASNEEKPNEISLYSRIEADRHFSKAEEMFMNLEKAFKDIELELLEQTDHNSIEEVIVILGSTPSHPQNIFRIKLPSLSLGHKEENHPSRKLLPCLFQALISSEELQKVLNIKICPTNVFILLKSKDSLKSDTFYQNDSFSIPGKTAQIKFLLKSDRIKDNCSCGADDMFPVFCDTPSRHLNAIEHVIYRQPGKIKPIVTDLLSTSDIENGDEDDNIWKWFQFNQTIKGFKDCKINGTSVANIWLKCTAPYSLTS